MNSPASLCTDLKQLIAAVNIVNIIAMKPLSEVSNGNKTQAHGDHFSKSSDASLGYNNIIVRQ